MLKETGLVYLSVVYGSDLTRYVSWYSHICQNHLVQVSMEILESIWSLGELANKKSNPASSTGV
jgi:hypothetical protein